MKKKNIYENFQENGKNLRSEPSDRAWRRLESRLDGSQGVNKTLKARNWLMVASVALIVGALGFITMTNQSTQNTMTAKNEITATFVVEDLVYSDVNMNKMPSVQLQRHLENNDWKKINEGKATSKLVAVKVNKSPSKGSEPVIAPIKSDVSNRQFNHDAYDISNSDNSMTYNDESLMKMKDKTPNSSYDDYRWLEGDWETSNSRVGNNETWAFNGSIELSNANTKTTSKKMPFIIGLQCFRVDCNLKMVVDKDGETEVFESLDKKAEYSTFQNMKDGYPQNVELKKIDESWYSLTLSGGGITERQKVFLEESGFIFDGSIGVRRMERVIRK